MSSNSGSVLGRLLWLIVLAGAAGGGGWWYYHQDRQAAPQYLTAAVVRGDLTQVVTATGQLNPRTNVQVGSQISGILEKVLVDYNSPVKAGQVIAKIDPATFQATVHQAEGDLADAKSKLELAEVETKRTATLFKDKLVSQSDYDKALADLHQAEAAVKIKTASLEKTTVDLARCTIYAPVDGIVISRSVDVGQTVAASLSAPTLFLIANDLTQMQIDANVAEADIGGIEVGQEVEFTVDAFVYRPFRGKVIQIRNSPITVQNVVTYDTVIEVNNADLKLKPGMTANVSIVLASRSDVLKLPNAALRFRIADTNAPGTRTGGAGGGGQRLAGGPPGGGAGGGGGGAGRGFGGGGGPGGGGRGGGGAWSGAGGRARGERQFNRTVYLPPSTNAISATGEPPKPTPVQIKIGISDGVMTEIVEGLKEGDAVVTALANVDPTAAAARPNNPFSGGMRMR